MLEEIDRLAGDVLSAEAAKPPPEPMSEKYARNMRKTADAFYIVTVIFSLLLGIALLLNTFAADGVFGLRFFVEPTKVMLGEVPYGSLLVTVTRPSSRIAPGDVVTYYALPGDPGSRLTRIVDERLENGGIPLFRTKAAGNAAPDSMTINMTHILGVKLLVIPYAGHAASFMQTYAWGFAVLAGALCVAAAALRAWAAHERPGLKRGKGKRAKKRRKGRVLHAS